MFSQTNGEKTSSLFSQEFCISYAFWAKLVTGRGVGILMGMTCNEFRQGHPAGGEAARAHLAQCADCREFDRSWDLLREYPAIEPSAGFFLALRRKLQPAVLRFAAPLAAAAAALLVALLLARPTTPPAPVGPVVTEEERELVDNLELLQNYELVRTLELVGENGSPLIEEKK